MNKDRVCQWTTALRSGDYQQGEEYLRSSDCFCCLGVLADIVNDEQGEGIGVVRQCLSEQTLDADFLPICGICTGEGVIPGLLPPREMGPVHVPRANNAIALTNLNDGVWVTHYELGYMRAKSKVIADLTDYTVDHQSAIYKDKVFIKLSFEQIADIIEEFGEFI